MTVKTDYFDVTLSTGDVLPASYLASIKTLLTQCADIRLYGAVGDGSTDDTVAIQAALDSGLDVYVPGCATHYAVTSVLVLSTAGQRVYGDGVRSKIVQSGTNSNANVFTASVDNVQFTGLHLVPGTTLSSTFNGFGIYLDSVDHAVVQNVLVVGARRGGIGLLDCDTCNISNNIIRDSVVDGTDVQSDTGFDIYLGGDCSYNIVQGNHCVNGSGVGIGVQTLTSGDSCVGNVIDSNIIRSQDVYGIMLYILNVADTVDRNIVSNNIIDGVSGAVTQDDLSDIYGAGIFVQTADHTVIQGNQIRNTNSSGGTPPTTGVPAAIALSGTIANATIIGNLIEDSGYYGIAFVTASAITHAGRGLVIQGNSIRNPAAAGVFLSNAVRAVVSGNNIDGAAAAQAINIRQDTVSQSDDFVVADNLINDFTVGIQFSGTIARSIVHDNIIRGNTGAAIALTAAFSNCHDNTIVQGAGGDGISMNSAVVNGFCRNNFITGGDYGVINDGGGTARVEDNIIVSAGTASYSTSSSYPLANSATPTVRNVRWASNANTTTITNLTDGYEGQVLTIYALASFTMTDNSNIVLAGAANFAMVSGDTLTLRFTGNAWVELSRGDN